MSKYMKKKQKASWQKRALSCLCVILGLVLAIMVAGTVYYESLLNKINRPGDQGSLTLEELEQLLQEDIADATGEAVDDNVQIDDAQQIFTGADTTMTVSTMMHGEYGVEDVCLSSLCIVGKEGIAGKIVAPLTPEEEDKFRHSANCLKEVIKSLDI